MNKIFVLIPLFNEEQNISELISGLTNWEKQFSNFLFHFIFIDDYSSDNTVEELRKCTSDMNYTILKHEKNAGPGKAFSTGFKHISTIVSTNDLVVTMEGDNTSRIDTFKTMLGRIEHENAD